MELFEWAILYGMGVLMGSFVTTMIMRAKRKNPDPKKAVKITVRNSNGDTYSYRYVLGLPGKSVTRFPAKTRK